MLGTDSSWAFDVLLGTETSTAASAAPRDDTVETESSEPLREPMVLAWFRSNTAARCFTRGPGDCCAAVVLKGTCLCERCCFVAGAAGRYVLKLQADQHTYLTM